MRRGARLAVLSLRAIDRRRDACRLRRRCCRVRCALGRVEAQIGVACQFGGASSGAFGQVAFGQRLQEPNDAEGSGRSFSPPPSPGIPRLFEVGFARQPLEG
jgi:hypothetical protein